jgi:hypothetical protein
VNNEGEKNGRTKEKARARRKHNRILILLKYSFIRTTLRNLLKIDSNMYDLDFVKFPNKTRRQARRALQGSRPVEISWMSHEFQTPERPGVGIQPF